MITNSNASSNGGVSVDYPKYVGVATVSILGVNPNNATKRKFGWNIPEDAPEKQYVRTDSEGKKVMTVSLLARIEDLEEKPVITLDFNWLRPDMYINKDNTKCQVIDSYCRTAWVTREELKKHAIPQYSNGPAELNSDYKPCHRGEDKLAKFWFKFLNITPFSVMQNGQWVKSKNPGQLTIDHWDWLMNGDVTEMNQMLANQPDNKMKVILGVRTNDDNKSYQTFLCESGIGSKSTFFGNGIRLDANTNEYAAAVKAIAEYQDRYTDTMFSAKPVEYWSVTPTSVVESNTMESTSSLFDDDMPMDEDPF